MEDPIVISDKETRQRLLEAAGRLFADRGFKDVSIREICKEAGGANLAAVNYYFRDKAGLYRELLEHMIRIAWQPRREQLLKRLEGKAAEEKLRIYVRSLIGDVLGENQDEFHGFFDRMLEREMADPTPQFEVVVEQGMRPNFRLLSEIVAEVMSLALDDGRVLRATLSTMGQCLIYGSMRRLSKYFAPGVEFTPGVIDGIATGVAEYSLAGIRALAQQTGQGPAYTCATGQRDETSEPEPVQNSEEKH